MVTPSDAPTFHDKLLVCLDCQHDFVWTAGDQLFYFGKKLLPPKRCAPCRARRKATITPPPDEGR